MNQIIEKRLNEYGINIEEVRQSIFKKIKESSDMTIFLYCTQMEGLGNKDSDIDVYVICNNPQIPEDDIKEININGLEFDTEYYAKDYIMSLIKRVNDKSLFKLSNDELKILQRLSFGEVILNEDYGNKLKTLIDSSNMNIMAEFNMVFLIIAMMEDCMKFYNNHDYESSLIQARNILDPSLLILNSRHGHLNLNMKWQSKMFIDNKGYEKDYLERYYKYFLYPNKLDRNNICHYIKELLYLAHDMVSYSLVYPEHENLYNSDIDNHIKLKGDNILIKFDNNYMIVTSKRILIDISETCARIFCLCNGFNSSSYIIERVSNEMQVGPELITEEMERFIGKLNDMSLLEKLDEI